ncbi:MAG: peptidylprolyl isomerase [Bacteroidota bacterium]
MKRFIVLSLLLSFVIGAQAQADDEVLFSVAGREVTVGEFKYIYDKTNGDAADYSRKSLQEYLDLYQRFKLKVAKAYDMQLDTVKGLQQELAGYRRQLAENYLVDRAITDKLVEELYQRKQQDVEISHILFSLPQKATPEQEAKVMNTAESVKQSVTVANFAEKAKQYSQDRFSKDNGGKIGFLTAPFPNGMYNLETAVYDAQPNTILGPVKTTFGIHLVMVHEKRPARGEIEAAHIMLRKKQSGKDPVAIKGQIDNIYKLLTAGQSFEKLAATMSQDDKTRKNGGYIGFFGINRYEKGFEEAAFTIAEDSGFSEVVESEVGYHIIKRISRRGIQPLADERPLLSSKVKADGRFQLAEEALLASIRQRVGVAENKALLGQYAAQLQDSTFLTFQWKAPATKDERELFKIGPDYVVSLGDFQSFLQQSSRKRVSYLRGGNSYQAASEMYEEFFKKELMAYEEAHLEDNYPDFRALMREYQEGILLFEATKLEVWDKASQDSLGLEKYFQDHRDAYQWEERAQVTQYTVPPALVDNIGDVLQAARAGSAEEVAKQTFGDSKTPVKTRTDTYEQERLSQVTDVSWKAGSMSKPEKNKRTGHLTFYKVESLLPAAAKELSEARGYVIADYQDQLEKEWVNALKKEYNVKLKKRVLDKMVKR